jgi:hypothetical protein
VSDEKLTLRSYRLAFELERRIHRVDRFRIPVPYGLPLAGVGYAAVVAIGVLFASRIPGLGQLLGALPWPFRLILLPGLGAHILCRPTGDGRPVHEALVARLYRRVQPRQLIALRRAPRTLPGQLGVVAVVHDERGAAYRRGKVSGPAVVELRQPACLTAQRGTAELHQLADRPMLHSRGLVLGPGERLRIR